VAGSDTVSPQPPVTSGLTVLALLAAIPTLGPEPLLRPDTLAFDPAAPAGLGLVTWWLVHGSLGHLVTNLVVLWWVAPPLERHVGSLRTTLAVGVGIVGGMAVHALVHGPTAPIIGASSIVAALAAYNLVVGWHRPVEDRRGRALLWPSHLFHGVVAFEGLRMLAELATGAVPTGAAAHVGGLLAGVLVCGAMHGRWPARPASRAPLRSRPVADLLSNG
jgi:membrane associated rhomboid family serine protease